MNATMAMCGNTRGVIYSGGDLVKENGMNGKKDADERWLKALRAKNIAVRSRMNSEGERSEGKRKGSCKTAAHSAFGTSVQRAQPFKATGHKGGISRQGS